MNFDILYMHESLHVTEGATVSNKRIWYMKKTMRPQFNVKLCC